MTDWLHVFNAPLVWYEIYSREAMQTTFLLILSPDFIKPGLLDPWIKDQLGKFSCLQFHPKSYKILWDVGAINLLDKTS